MEEKKLKNNFIHPTAICETTPQNLGGGITMWQHVVVQDEVRIGDGCKIGANSFIEKNVSIGNRVTIKNNVAIYTGVTIEDDVFLGPSCVFTNVINPRSFISRKHEFRHTIVQRGASIGANATIICGNTIGRYAMVGAGSVVTKDVPNHTLVVGNPARIVGYVCDCGCKLSLSKEDRFYRCSECAKSFDISLFDVTK